MRRLILAATFVGGLLAPAGAAAAPDLKLSAATASPNPARTGEQVTISITATNAGASAPAYPVFLRIEAQGTQWGETGTTCPPGATQTKGNECRLGGPLAPGESATMTLSGFSPEAEVVQWTGTAFAYDDPDHGNDTQGGSLTVEGPTNDGSRPGSVDAGLGPFRLAKPTLSTSRLKAGRKLKVATELDRPAELSVKLEKRVRCCWESVRGTVRDQAGAGRASLTIGPRFGGRRLAPGSYRLTLFATSRTGEKAVAEPVRFTIAT